MSAPPSLLKTAYYACNKIERNKYDLLGTLDVDMQSCCWSLFKIIKINRKLNGYNNTNRGALYGRLNRRYAKRFKNICTEAVVHKHTNCLRLANEIGVGWGDGKAIGIAAKSGNLAYMRYASENGCPWETYTSHYAAESGSLDCLRYVRENGCQFDRITCMFAAISGSLECLRYARENGCSWDEWTCNMAALSGNMECLRYAVENRCPWATRTCMYASEAGNLEALKYLRESGCPWDRGTRWIAKKKGHSACLAYALENGL